MELNMAEKLDPQQVITFEELLRAIRSARERTYFRWMALIAT